MNWRESDVTTVVLLAAVVVMYVLAYGVALRWGASL